MLEIIKGLSKWNITAISEYNMCSAVLKVYKSLDFLIAPFLSRPYCARIPGAGIAR